VRRSPTPAAGAGTDALVPSDSAVSSDSVVDGEGVEGDRRELGTGPAGAEDRPTGRARPLEPARWIEPQQQLTGELGELDHRLGPELPGC
jgi:hypothetical protein